MKVAYENFLNRVKEAKKVKIFGAGKLAKTLCYLLRKNNIEIEAFVVTNPKENVQKLLDTPVWNLDSIVDADLCNIIVGFESRDITGEIVGTLLKKKAENIIMVSQDMIDDIYCNFILDEDSLVNFCEQLKTEKEIIIYINDNVGKLVLEYFINNDMPISAICTDNPNFIEYSSRTVISFDELIKYDKDISIVMTMDNVRWQRGFITKLRSNGFEKIILMSKEIITEIKENKFKILWENKNSEYKVIENGNVEKWHYIVESIDNEKVYRWRVPDDYRFDFSAIRKVVKNNKLIKEYEKQYPGCRYLAYKENELYKLTDQGYGLEVYMAKFYKDKQIIEETMPEWVIPIQVGKALTDIQVAQVCDNIGEHISEKNVDYSEGTALYWIWKNTKGQDYVGLFHYRRQMAMDEKSLKQILQYDVTLTLPTYLPIEIKKFFCDFFILEHDWELMMRFIKEYDEVYYKTALDYESGHFYFPCNIFIMKRMLFDNACSFIFGVLQKVDDFYNNLHMVRRDRYLGYLIENLLSIYIMHNAKKLKVAYTDMKYECALNDN